jgi:membrane protease YdiL (CAAX protease family)
VAAKKHSDKSTPSRTAPPAAGGYWQQSLRPLVSLVFVLPMLAAYEGGIVALGPQATHNGAAVWLQHALATLGLGQYVLLPVVTCAALLALHYISRQPWKFSPWVLGGMLVESAMLAIFLVVIFRGYSTVIGSLAPRAALASTGDHVGQLLGYFGAGIYEELLFRLILLTLIAGVVEAAGAPKRASLITAIIASSVIFAAAHYELFAASGLEFSWRTFGFHLVCGLYFGTIYVLRGFGIAAGAHAFYDVLVFAGLF